VLDAAVRAARRAVAANPADAGAHYLLGEAYLQLLTTTCERGWAARLPQLARLRQVQAVAAFTRAVALNPGLGDAHRELGLLYQQFGYLDLSLKHLRAHQAAVRAGRAANPVAGAVLDRLAEVVDRESRAFAEESARISVADRAALAVRRGLGGKALALLLESDISAFGEAGMRLELDLLLKTGRCDDVLNWTAADLEGVLGGTAYHWMRAQAQAAVGSYADADTELAALAGRPAPPAAVAGTVGGLVGRAVLDEQAGVPYLPQQVWRALARDEFLTGLGGVIRGLSVQADQATVRGLVAREAGEVEAARQAFGTALTLAGEGAAGGGLPFGGRPAARACAAWIDAARR
jgi:tetratricopeptide (TPR) repeat protein